MSLNLKAAWKSLGKGKPGWRFQARYERNQRSRASRRLLPRLLRFAGAAAALAIGVVLVFIPGPAVLFFLLAGALLATDSLWIARGLDWLEVRLRRLGGWAKQNWLRLPRTGRVVLIAAAGSLTLASAYGFYRLIN